MTNCDFCSAAIAAVNSVALHPCGCAVCKDCWIQRLVETRLDPVLLCASCGQVVVSHVTGQRGEKNDANSATSPSAATTVQQAAPRVASAAARPAAAVARTKRTAKQTPKKAPGAKAGRSGTPRKPKGISAQRARKRQRVACKESKDDERSAKRSRSSSATDAKPPGKRAGGKYKTIEERIRELTAYKETHGNCDVKTTDPDHKSLGYWVSDVRKGERKLTDEARAQLTEMGFDWEPKPRGRPKKPKEEKVKLYKSNSDYIQELVAYKERHGDCNVPRAAKYPENPQLPRWMGEIRRGDRKLAAEERKTLDAMGFHWGRRKNKKFDDWVVQLKEFKALHGHCSVPYRYEPNPKLGEWVKDVRRGHTKISMEQRKLLNTLGFNWETKRNRFQREWNEKLERLKAYKEQYGDCRVPWNWEPDRQLAEWCNTQRKLQTSGKLQPDRKEALDELGFVFSSFGQSLPGGEHSGAGPDDEEETHRYYPPLRYGMV
jgi:hypothetical protein